MKRIALTAAITLAACAPTTTRTIAVEGVYTPDGPPHTQPSTTDVTERTVTTLRASRSRPVSVPPSSTGEPVGGESGIQDPSAPIRTVTSTAYSQGGRTASGQQTHPGIVAMNGVAFGSRWLILSGPLAGQVLTAEDRIGCCSGFDVFVASEAQAVAYGRRVIQIEQVAA